jgi:protein-tyrosine kinase
MTRLSAGSESSNGVVVLDEMDKLINDRYRLLFAKIDLISRREDKKVIAVTSALKGEGKTTTATNLAVISARDFGKRVLLIDGDFKNPSVSRSFRIGQSKGIVDVIANLHSFDETVKDGPVQGLSILTMGGLSSGKVQGDRQDEGHIWTGNGMKSVLSDVREYYDYIWIDAPPILPLFDMSVISETVDGILIVVRAGETSEAVLSRAVKVLGPDKVIGSVLNRLKKTWGSRYYGYGDT